MYEPVNGPKRLTEALWMISDNEYAMELLARILNYTSAQLLQDIEALPI